MERAGDAELADEEHERAEHTGLPVDAGPEDAEAHEVNADEENTGQRQAYGTMHKANSVRAT
jgi:hypothetical protein